MALVISVKNRDIGNWRAAGEFAVNFREALLARTATLLSEEAEALFRDVEHTLEQGAIAHEQALLRMRGLIGQAAQSRDPAELGNLVGAFQNELFSFFGWNRSAPAYFRLQAELYQAVAAAAVGISLEKTGLADVSGQSMALIALGDGGRGEFSPSGRVQLLLLHDDSMQPERAGLLGETLHATFVASGLLPDDAITPRSAPWRSGRKALLERLTGSVKGEGAKELPELLRLAEQRLLHEENGFGAGFREECLNLISGSRSILPALMAKLHALNSGIGLMGGVKLERSGPGRGRFRLYGHALQPLSEGVAALSLLKGETASETPERIRGLLAKGHLDVETAERLLNAWHYFNEHRLALEAQSHASGKSTGEMYLDYTAMGEPAQDEFKHYLEATAALLRHVSMACSSWEEQR